jgi:hypothetical protein
MAVGKAELVVWLAALHAARCPVLAQEYYAGGGQTATAAGGWEQTGTLAEDGPSVQSHPWEPGFLPAAGGLS